MYKPLFILILVFTFTLSLGAANYFGGETITIREIDTLDTDVFSGCRNLDVLGVVEGDVFAGCRATHS